MDNIINPNFTLDETSALFREFAFDTGIVIDDDVIEDIWLKSNGCVSWPVLAFSQPNHDLVIRVWFAFVDA
jgi:hypothetical protein